jgi:transposase
VGGRGAGLRLPRSPPPPLKAWDDHADIGARAGKVAGHLPGSQLAALVHGGRSVRSALLRPGARQSPAPPFRRWTRIRSRRKPELATLLARESRGDFKRRATKWRCPIGECKPASTWIKADRLHPLIPRETERSAKLYRSRGAVEREFGRLKHERALLPLRVRGLDRVKLHADLTILAKLACALSRTRAVPLLAA